MACGETPIFFEYFGIDGLPFKAKKRLNDSTGGISEVSNRVLIINFLKRGPILFLVDILNRYWLFKGGWSVALEEFRCLRPTGPHSVR